MSVPSRTAFLLPRLSNAANHSKIWMAAGGVMAVAGGRAGRRAAQRGLLSVGLASALVNGVLKPLLPRTRPPAVVVPVPLTEHFVAVRRPTSSSFPSGHSASAAAFATATAMEAPAFAAPIAALAAGVAYSRVSTGVHYPSDVVVGSAIGAAIAVGTRRLWPLVDPTPAAAKPVSAAQIVAEPSVDGAGLIVIVNDSAGPSAHRSETGKIAESLPQAEIVSVGDAHDLSDALDEAATRAVALGVVGGDGTIGAAAAAAAAADIALVVFPGGTLNHFARDLGVDSIDDAIDAVKTGTLVEVDGAYIDGRLFLNTASLGNYSAFVDAREALEDRIGKWPAVFLALAKMLARGETFELIIDGTPTRIWMIFVGNCAYDPPGFAPATRARLDDGLLDLRLIDGTQPAARLRLLGAVLTGRLNRSRVYSRRLVKSLELSTGADAAVLAADGETFGGHGSFVIEKSARPIRVYSPHRS